MPSVPYCPEFCIDQNCPHFVHRGECELDECIHNNKWIRYWEAHGKYPPYEGE